jgi:sec-independent protein translocase protein TatA
MVLLHDYRRPRDYSKRRAAVYKNWGDAQPVDAIGDCSMGGLSPWHIIIVVVLVLVIFGGRGKLSGLMGDAAKGIRAFRDGLKGDEDAPPATPPTLAQVEVEKDTVVR